MQFAQFTYICKEEFVYIFLPFFCALLWVPLKHGTSTQLKYRILSWFENWTCSAIGKKFHSAVNASTSTQTSL
jgi:hypothetical protein